MKSNGEGFVDLCKGSEGEFYLLHKDRESVYLFNEEWSGKRGVKLFKNGLIAPRSIIYHADKNALIVAQDFANSVFLTPALKCVLNKELFLRVLLTGFPDTNKKAAQYLEALEIKQFTFRCRK